MSGIPSTPRRRIAVGAIAATTVLATLSGPSSASANRPSGPAKVSGQGRIFYAYSPDDEIRFTVDATAAPFSRPLDQLPKGMPTDARGKVTFSHWVARTKETRTAEAAVDCLVTGGDTATLTAVITKSADPEEIGTRYGFSVKSGARAAAGSPSAGASPTWTSSMASSSRPGSARAWPLLPSPRSPKEDSRSRTGTCPRCRPDGSPARADDGAKRTARPCATSACSSPPSPGTASPDRTTRIWRPVAPVSAPYANQASRSRMSRA